MIEIAGGRRCRMRQRREAQVAEPAAESDQVPTVSGVVLRLGPGDAAPEPAAAEPAPAGRAGGRPRPDRRDADRDGRGVERIHSDPRRSRQWRRRPSGSDAPKPEPSLLPDDRRIAAGRTGDETALLASFEQMETRPFPPPEEGTAVIFTPRPTAKPQPADAAPETSPGARLRPNRRSTAEPHRTGSRREPLPEAACARTRGTPSAAPPKPRPPAAAVGNRFRSDRFPVRPRAGTRPRRVPARSGAAAGAEAASAAAGIRRPAARAAGAGATAAAEAEAEQPRSRPQPEPAPHDPLRALKAMSPNERLAIFS